MADEGPVAGGAEVMAAGGEEIGAAAGMDVGVFIFIQIIRVVGQALGDFVDHFAIGPLVAEEEAKGFGDVAGQAGAEISPGGKGGFIEEPGEAGAVARAGGGVAGNEAVFSPRLDN